MAAYTDPTDTPDDGSHTHTPSTPTTTDSHDTGDQVTSSSPPPARGAALSCAAATGRTTNSRTDSTGSPALSARSTDTALTPIGAIRTRTRDAPAACKHTPCQENGNIVSAWSPTTPIACRAASSSTGWMPKPSTAPPAASGTVTSANTSLSTRHMACRPWKAGPYS
ncbi:hypothetical protein MYSI104531_04745 [Mycobacterium simiae]